MKYLPQFVITPLVMSLFFSFNPAAAQEHKDLKVVSYLFGADMGASIKRGELELDIERFIDGLKLTYGGEELKFSREDRGKILGAFRKDELLPRPVVEDIVSYLMGGDVGANMKRSQMEFEIDSFVEGLGLAYRGEKLKYSEQDHRRILSAFAMDRQVIDRKKALMTSYGVKTAEEWNTLAGKNKKAGEDFLAANARNEGVNTTASGLQYQIFTRGEGEIPKRTDKVRAVCRGALIDGTVFEESEIIESRVGNEIPGLAEALQMMTVGSKWKVFVPADLAYAETGHRPPVGPNTALVFDVELLEITKPVSLAGKAGGAAPAPVAAVKFPGQKGGKVEMTPVDPKTGKPVGETRVIGSKKNSDKK